MATFNEIMEYSPENQKVFEELAGLCIRKLIVPYVGAGMSAFAGFIPVFKTRSLFPTWGNLICGKYESCFSKPKPDTMDYIEAADEIEQKLGEKAFYDYICDTMGGMLNDAEWKEVLDNAENQAISYIPKLFFAPIVTTNFDLILEKIHNDKIPVAFPYNTERLNEAIQNRTPLIYKIHGCVSDPQNIVLAKRKYEEVYSLDGCDFYLMSDA